jgi:hypothetical protein
MESIIRDVLTGMTIDTVINLVILLIAVFLSIAVRNFVQHLVALQSFKNSMNIAIGTTVRMPTPTGHIDGEIVRVNSKRIVIETEVSYIYVPTIDFSKKTWQILK